MFFFCIMTFWTEFFLLTLNWSKSEFLTCGCSEISVVLQQSSYIKTQSAQNYIRVVLLHKIKAGIIKCNVAEKSLNTFISVKEIHNQFRLVISLWTFQIPCVGGFHTRFLTSDVTDHLIITMICSSVIQNSTQTLMCIGITWVSC